MVLIWQNFYWTKDISFMVLLDERVPLIPLAFNISMMIPRAIAREEWCCIMVIWPISVVWSRSFRWFNRLRFIIWRHRVTLRFVLRVCLGGERERQEDRRRPVVTLLYASLTFPLTLLQGELWGKRVHCRGRCCRNGTIIGGDTYVWLDRCQALSCLDFRDVR
jgi:hypothetical protein